MFIMPQSCDISIYFALFSTIIARFSGQWQESSSKIKNGPSFSQKTWVDRRKGRRYTK